MARLVSWRTGSRVKKRGVVRVLAISPLLFTLVFFSARPVFGQSSTLYSNSSTGQVGIGTSIPTAGASLDMGSNTNSVLLPSGTTAQRPVGINGMLRFNSTNSVPEFYAGTWLPVPLSASTPIVINSATGNVACPTCATNGRTRLSGNQIFYLSTTGSDSNDCLTPTSACATLTHVWNLVATTYDLAGYVATIQLADGTYTHGLDAEVAAIGGQVIINGDSASPGNVVISATGEDAVLADGPGVSFTIQNLKMTQSGGGYSDLNALATASIFMGPGLIFGAVDTTDGAQIGAQEHGSIFIEASYSIVGGGAFHYYVADGSLIRVDNSSLTVSITGTPAFTDTFASSTEASQLVLGGLSFSGAASGSRYTVVLNGVIDTETGNVSYLPGSSSGTTATGGQYN